MNRRIRIKRWEVTWLVASGAVLLVLLAGVAYSLAGDLRSAARLREEVASAFEHPACERLTRAPVMELLEMPQVEAPCFWVVHERRSAHQANRPTHITAADVRAWSILWLMSYRLRVRWDMFLLALALSAAMYGTGLLIEFVVARRLGAVSSPRAGGRH